MPDRRNIGPVTDGRDARGRFGRGNAGKPIGARARVAREAEGLLDQHAGTLTAKAVELALAGDIAALRLCLDRILPARKDRPVEVDLPPVEGAKDHPAAIGALVEAVASGDLAPAEANAITGILDAHRRAVETAELVTRIEALEERNAK